MITATRATVLGFALANLYLLSLTGPLVSPQHELVFHLPGSATSLFVPVLLDIVIVWAVLAVALWAVRHRPRAQLLLWSILLLALPSGLITTMYGFANKPVARWLSWPTAGAALVLLLVCNGLWRRVLPRFMVAQPLITMLLSFLAFPGLLVFLQLFWFGWATRDLNPPFRPAPPLVNAATAGPGAHPVRVVWIVLDELAFDQVYGRRYAGLMLPNFDRLAAESAVFTQAVPAAEYTRRALPSLLTGLPLRSTRPSASGRLLMFVNSQTGRHTVFDPQDTVFGDARRAGLPTAVAGWYEPYCRLLPAVLDRCFWTYSDELPGGLTTDGSLLQHTLEPFVHFLRLSFRPAGIGPVPPTRGALDVHRHYADYEALLAASDDLLRSGTPGLVLLHMPIPHPWGFYDRRTGTFPDHRTSYLDNLALADAYIGRIRAELEAQGLWDSTDVLVTGDHSWRTSAVWSTSAHWTAEEQAASHHGGFDDRPAVVLKLHGQTTGARIDVRFDTVRTRALIDMLLADRLSTTEALRAWVSE